MGCGGMNGWVSTWITARERGAYNGVSARGQIRDPVPFLRISTGGTRCFFNSIFNYGHYYTRISNAQKRFLCMYHMVIPNVRQLSFLPN